MACHLRVQNIGLKTRDILQLVPGTTVEPIERCSGHDGTYGVKRKFRETSMKIGKPVIQRVESSGADFYTSDCPMAGHQIESGLPANPARASIDPALAWPTVFNEAESIACRSYHAGLDESGAICGRAVAAARRGHRAQAAPQGAGRTEHDLDFRGPDDHPLSGARDAARRAHFRSAGIQDELDAYNPLVPDGTNWKVDFAARVSRCRCAPGSSVEADRRRGSVLGPGGELPRVFAIADEDLDRENEDKTSAVHFLRFELSSSMIEAAKSGAPLSIGVDHENYRHSVAPLPAPVRDALTQDLD